MSEVAILKEHLRKRLSTQERLDTLITITEKLWKKSEFSEAKKHAEIALELSRSTKMKRHEASANYLIGLMNTYLNKYDIALEYQYRALKLHKEIGNDQSTAEDYNNIGKIHILMDNYSKALESFEAALDYHPQFARTYNNLSHAYNHLQQYDKALEYGLKAMDLSAEKYDTHPDRERTHIFAHINVGEIYLNMQQYDDAVEIMQKALTLSESKPDDTPMISHYYLGLTYKNISRLDDALAHFLKALALSDHHENKEYLIAIYRGLCEIYEEKGELKQALSYLKKQMALDKKIYTDHMANRLAKMQAAYEVETEALKAQQMAEKVSKLASLGVMSAGITHEINQPLCAIKVSAESILYWNKKHNQILPEPFTEGLKDISEAANYINDIIQHMRSFWHMPSNTQSQVVNLNSVIPSALSLIERQLYSHGVFLELDLAENLPEICIDTVHLEQIIINIVINAMHALDETDKSDKRIVIATREYNGTVELCIRDNGTGLPHNIGTKLYDPFFSTKQPGKGMGLGLAIVKTYLDKYKAQIQAENNQWGGATFCITFVTVEEDSCES
jgi:signal transduction histidine kinase